MLWLRFLHIAAAVAFIGGVIARQLVRARANAQSDVHAFALLSLTAARIETLMVIPGNLLVIVFGVILAIEVDAPLFGFLEGDSENWLLATLVLLVIGMLSVPLFFMPRGRRFDAALEDALERGEMTPELMAGIHDPALRVVHALEITLLFVILGLMVFKPF